MIKKIIANGDINKIKYNINFVKIISELHDDTIEYTIGIHIADPNSNEPSVICYFYKDDNSKIQIKYKNIK